MHCLGLRVYLAEAHSPPLLMRLQIFPVTLTTPQTSEWQRLGLLTETLVCFACTSDTFARRVVGVCSSSEKKISAIQHSPRSSPDRHSFCLRRGVREYRLLLVPVGSRDSTASGTSALWHSAATYSGSQGLGLFLS